MRYTKKLGILASALVLCVGCLLVSASAQVRVGINFGHHHYRRPVVVQRYYAPTVRYGYYNNYPYGNYRSEKYYDRQSLNYARRRLNKDENKYYSDGYLTSKEQRKLYEDKYKLQRDRQRLRNNW